MGAVVKRVLADGAGTGLVLAAPFAVAGCLWPLAWLLGAAVVFSVAALGLRLGGRKSS